MLNAHMNYLKRTTAVGNVLRNLSRQTFDDVNLRVGMELGLLTVIEDKAYKKATNRSRNIVVYTLPEERAAMQMLK